MLDRLAHDNGFSSLQVLLDIISVQCDDKTAKAVLEIFQHQQNRIEAYEEIAEEHYRIWEILDTRYGEPR